MANALQINSFELLTKHRANMAASLAHRLDVARATQNAQLIALLEQERQQLRLADTADSLTSLAQNFKNWWQGLMLAIANSSKLSVRQVYDDYGVIWWHAYDPKTGKTLYADSESDIVQWIEDNRIGQ